MAAAAGKSLFSLGTVFKLGIGVAAAVGINSLTGGAALDFTKDAFGKIAEWAGGHSSTAAMGGIGALLGFGLFKNKGFGTMLAMTALMAVAAPVAGNMLMAHFGTATGGLSTMPSLGNIFGVDGPEPV